MFLAASLEVTVVYLIIAGVFGLISWLKNKGAGTNPRAPQQQPPPGNTEEERMRKFLEALGLPADEAPPPPKRAAPVAPPPLPQPREKQKRKPRPVVTDRSLDEAPAPSLRVEELHLPELETRAVAEFHTHSSEVSAIPTEPPVITFADPYAGAQRQIPADILRRLLRSSNEVRSAILLREVLGPPRGLQP